MSISTHRLTFLARRKNKCHLKMITLVSKVITFSFLFGNKNNKEPLSTLHVLISTPTRCPTPHQCSHAQYLTTTPGTWPMLPSQTKSADLWLDGKGTGLGFCESLFVLFRFLSSFLRHFEIHFVLFLAPPYYWDSGIVSSASILVFIDDRKKVTIYLITMNL